jgi:hypothetical protein
MWSDNKKAATTRNNAPQFTHLVIIFNFPTHNDGKGEINPRPFTILYCLRSDECGKYLSINDK